MDLIKYFTSYMTGKDSEFIKYLACRVKTYKNESNSITFNNIEVKPHKNESNSITFNNVEVKRLYSLAKEPIENWINSKDEDINGFTVISCCKVEELLEKALKQLSEDYKVMHTFSVCTFYFIRIKFNLDSILNVTFKRMSYYNFHLYLAALFEINDCIIAKALNIGQ